MPTPGLLVEPQLPTCFTTGEPRQAQAYLSKLFRQHSLRLANPAGPIEFFHSAATVGSGLSIHHLAYGHEINNSGAASGDVYLAVLTLAGTLRMRVGNHEIVSPAGTLCVMNPQQSFSTHLSANHRQLTVCLSGNLLRHLLNASDTRRAHPLAFVPVATDAWNQAGTLTNMLMALCHEIGRSGSAIHQPRIASHFEQTLAALLLAEVPHNYGTPNEPVHDDAPDYIQRAIRFVHTRGNTRICVQDIANAAGVTARTLQIGFRRHLGVTPRMFLRNVRLDHAHDTLANATRHRTKVSHIAHDHGFENTSKFARYFRERFGHNPSALSRRRS